MDVVFVLMLVAALVIVIAMNIGLHGMSYLATWLKFRLTQLRKTKTAPTALDSQDS